MSSGRSACFALFIALSVSAGAQTLNNASLTGRYFVRHVQLSATDSRSIQGAITFSGSGSYGFVGQQVVGTGTAASYTASGTYAMSPSGIVTLSNPQTPGLAINARFGVEAVIGASTEAADNTFDLFVAIPSTATQTNANLNGTYYAADFELSPLRDSLLTLSMNGAGVVSTGSATGNYNVSAGTLTISGLAQVTGTQKALGVSNSGNVFLAATPGAHDIMIGVKSATSATLAPAFWMAGLRVDQDFAGSGVSINGTYITATQRLHETDAVLNVTQSNNYTTTAWGAAKIGIGVGGLMVSAGDQIGFVVPSPALTGSSVFINPRGVVNAASNAPGVDAISPGEFIAIYGTGLAAATVSSLPPYPALVGGVSVLIGGIQAPIYFVSAGQIDCLVPYGVTGTSATVTVTNNGVLSNAVTVPLAKTSPGIFTLDTSGTGDGALLHPDFSIVNSANPAKKGEVIQIYMTGLGALTTPIADGTGATAANFAVTPIQIYVGGVQVAAPDVLYWGVSSLPGLYQVNFRVPANLTVTGELPLAILTPDAFHDQVNIAVK